MASVINDPDGRKRIQFLATDGSRKTIRLGKASQRDAEQVCRHVEALAATSIHTQPVSRETAMWVQSIGPKLHERLARVGLVKARTAIEGTQLGAFVRAYIASRTDAKPGTLVNLDRAQREMVEHFGEGRALASITPGDADAFRLALLGKGLGENTIRRMCGRARQFFHAAVRRELIQRNPFDGMKCAVGANPERLYFVSRADADKVLAACPDAEWRLIFALSRYAGLRCPSEHLALRWGDVNWESNEMTVRSPKTEHHEGKASRSIPIFPELLPHLREVFEAAEPGTEHVITRYRQANCNLRTQLQRILGRAGLKPWPKLFHNLRATRETELAEHFPLHVVCAWIGNSSAIAAKHYLQVTKEHFERAIAPNASGEARAEKAAQNPAQQLHANVRKMSHDEKREARNPEDYEVFRPVAGGCDHARGYAMTGEGLEPSTYGLKGRCSTD